MSGLKNATRQSPSIARKLARQGALHLLPLYGLLRLSDLAREGIDHSGSYRFADHIYVGAPSGRTPIGRWLDARLLAMPAARAFRRRCDNAQAVVRQALESRPAKAGALRVLAVPCGIPRDLIELSRTLRSSRPELLERLEYHGMDLDPEVIPLATAALRDSGLRTTSVHQGDGLISTDYPSCAFHVVLSTGLGEFLDDDELGRLFLNVYHVLEPGGVFYTSATARDARSDLLLQIAELITRYRDADQLERILRRLPWRALSLTRDRTGLQTFVTAVR
jgi:SAM-dependent methyltransferase